MKQLGLVAGNEETGARLRNPGFSLLMEVTIGHLESGRANLLAQLGQWQSTDCKRNVTQVSAIGLNQGADALQGWFGKDRAVL
jgi:hypothetical protein